MNIYVLRRRRLCIISGLVIALIVISLFFINVSPFRAFDGVVWFKNGPHYISNQQVSEIEYEINTPKEVDVEKSVSKTTPYCDDVDEGFCKRASSLDVKNGDATSYFYKTLVSATVEYVPGTPDRQEVVGYCTLCADGTFSPSCAVGRGACSWHGGVAQYNYPEYRTIPGTEEIAAKPAVYSYTQMTYKDSANYIKPEEPSLIEVISFVK